ncbi:hypothetical protein EDB85DRAFT_2253461 [Lactarius pseudohatsudake]|nr:hypothetical protein EDB85DRAFT_2253461 [Lactarius pseudohatsudake]
MNRKKTGTGPDRNRLQPDLRLRFIRPENFTGCGSSQFGKWVNRYRAGWDRSQPVFTATTSHDHPTTRTSTTPTRWVLRPPFRHPGRLLRRRHRFLGPASTTTTSKQPRAITNDQRPRPSTSCRQPQPQLHQQPCQQHVDNHSNDQDDNTSTAARTTHRQRRHLDSGNINKSTTTTIGRNNNTSTTTTTTTHRQPQQQHDDSRNINTTTAASRNIITSTTITTAATTTPRQPRSTTTTRDNCESATLAATSTHRQPLARRQ